MTANRMRERGGMTHSKGPQDRIEPMATVVRTKPARHQLFQLRSARSFTLLIY